MDLPGHFIRAKQESRTQLELFSTSLAELLEKAEVTLHDVRRWRTQGWLELDPADPDTFERHGSVALRELQVLRATDRRGAPSEATRDLVATFGLPLAFDADRLAWSPRHGWVEPAPPDDPLEVANAHLEALIDELSEARAFPRLLDIQSYVNQAVAQALVRSAATEPSD